MSECRQCGGPCRVRSRVDASWYANDPFGYEIAVSQFHKHFTKAWRAEVREVRRQTRALVLAPSFGCVECGKFSFAVDGVRCFWCRVSVVSQAVVSAVIGPAPDANGRPSLDELRARITQQKAARKRGRHAR